VGTTINRNELERIALALDVARPRVRRPLTNEELLDRCLLAADREVLIRTGLVERRAPRPADGRAPGAPANDRSEGEDSAC
jgi:hypothetical protein